MKRFALRAITVLVVLGIIGFVLLPSVTAGAGDLVNASFETGDTSGWTVGRTIQGVWVVGAEDVPNAAYSPTGTVHVAPHEGDWMLRLGSPGYQDNGMNEVWQDFVVTEGTLRFAYNLCSYDFAPQDLFDYKVSLPDPLTGNASTFLYWSTQAPAGNTGAGLLCSDWQEVSLDLSTIVGKTARLTFSAGGNGAYPLRATFAYVDAPAAVQSVPAPLAATVGIVPSTLNPGAIGANSFVTAYLELPSGSDLSKVDATTVKLTVGGSDVPALGRLASVGDYDADGVPDVGFRFSRQALLSAVGSQVGQVEATLSGKIGEGSFSGVGTVRVLAKAK